MALGGTTVAELLARISSTELYEWEAFARMEPFGELRADWRAALVATVIANVNRDSKSKPAKMSDFLLRFERHVQTVDQQLRIVEMLNIAFGGKDMRPK